jgi:prevent-host-death family protein
MDVGIRELKARLSEFVDRAARGETIRVTDRGRAKALLGPLPSLHVDRGIEEGWIAPGGDEPPVRARRRFSAARSVAEVLEEDRGA